MQEEIKESVTEEIIEDIEPEKEEKKETKKEKKSKELKEIEKLKDQNSLLEDRNLRINAEMQNMYRRQQEELSKIYKYEGEGIIKEILPVLDNFERAMNAETTDEKYALGIKMIYASFVKILESKGIVEIVCLEHGFDPEYMEAVLTEERDGVMPDTVIEVLQKGYKYQDKVIRPAMVKVSK